MSKLRSGIRITNNESSSNTNNIGSRHIETADRNAVRIIERAYCAYRDKQMFRLLKHAVCAAEHSLTKEILKRIAPAESNLLNDPIFKVRIKFRFSGPEYPPFIVFKIFSQTHDGRSSKYINGKNTIKSTSSAAQEACSQMGTRKFYDLMILDRLQEQTKGKVAAPENVFSLRDYMQYSSVIDDLPAYMGGRSNSWRRFNLSDLPRHSVFYDVLNYASTKKVSKRLEKDMPMLLKPPVNPDIQLAHIRIISKLDSSPSEEDSSSSITSGIQSPKTPPPPNETSAYKSSLLSSAASSSSRRRRSKNAISKVLKMRKAYTNMPPRSETCETTNQTQSQSSGGEATRFKLPDELNDEFEKEVKNLYMWTQNLSVSDDFYLSSPRLGSAL